jgi:hypothetical protein
MHELKKAIELVVYEYDTTSSNGIQDQSLAEALDNLCTVYEAVKEKL